MHDVFVRDPLLIIPCGGQGFWEGGSHDFQREGRGDQSSPTEYKGLKKIDSQLNAYEGGGGG